MENLIDVCFLHSNTLLEEYAHDNLISKTKCNLNVISKEINGSYSDCMNELIEQSDSEHIIIFPSNLIVGDWWCEDLLYYSNNIPNTGCVGIKDVYNEKLKYQPLLTNDDKLVNVWVSENNIIEGVTMIKKSLLTEEIGMFDKLFDNTGFEQAEFSLKLAFNGYNNYYIRKQTTIPMEIKGRDEKFSKKTQNGMFLINEFVKANINFKEEIENDH